MKPAVLSLTFKGKTHRHELVPDELVTIGRASTCRIQISDASVSREHCVVIYTDDKICINDLQSTQGITYRGERVGRAELSPGDECRLGKVLACLALGASMQQTLQSPSAPCGRARQADGCSMARTLGWWR